MKATRKISSEARKGAKQKSDAKKTQNGNMCLVE